MLKGIAAFFSSFFKPSIPEGSTICAHCLKPITQGASVAHAWVGAPHPYAHATFSCDESGGAMYAGIWGNGRLKGLTEVYDFKKSGDSIVLTPKLTA